jgi:hypothetical protein
MRRVVLLAATAASALTACTTGPVAQTPSPPVLSTCANVSDLQVYPYSDNSEFTGYALARAWHVWFSSFGPVRSGKAVIAPFFLGVATKVVVHTDADLSQPVLLTGTECATGAALHFCYDQPDHCGLIGQTFTPDQLALRGFDHLSISGSKVDYTGYMLFARPGKYRLSVSSNAGELGSVTLGVAHAA